MSFQEISTEFPPIAAEPRIDWGRQRVWLHCLLLFLTLLTTCAVGSRMQYNFDHNLPFFDVSQDFDVFLNIWRHPATLAAGLPFSLTLLTILLAHEFGHFIACVYYGLDASLPYFLPFPSLVGTLGAFIRIRDPIYSRRTLFDVGIAGPLAGFVFLLPALTVGLALSKIIPGIAHQGLLTLGTPGVLRFFEALIFPGVPTADIYWHPVVRAGWVGLFTTGMNLLPIGQLDGGHIVYALIPSRHRVLSLLGLVCILPLAPLYWGWLIFAALVFLFGRRHPAIYDLKPLGRARMRLALVALAVFLLCFTTPILNS